jgi:hypothetical protein
MDKDTKRIVAGVLAFLIFMLFLLIASTYAEAINNSGSLLVQLGASLLVMLAGVVSLRLWFYAVGEVRQMDDASGACGCYALGMIALGVWGIAYYLWHYFSR